MSILSIQSHVAYGYVGNKAAVYPLQSMGYDVWPINTVQFSNHTGYGKWKGKIFEKSHIREIVDGVEELGVAEKCQAILSGYMGSKEICEEVYSVVQRFKSKNKKLIYLCDPVVGSDKCYLKSEVLEFFRNSLCADIVTPNQFESETLTEIKIQNTEDLKENARYFHERGVKVVVITGLTLGGFARGDFYTFVSSDQNYYLIKIKKYKFEIEPNGSGDLFSAIFLGYYLNGGDALESARKALRCIEKVMNITSDANSSELKVNFIHYSLEMKGDLPDFLEI